MRPRPAGSALALTLLLASAATQAAPRLGLVFDGEYGDGLQLLGALRALEWLDVPVDALVVGGSGVLVGGSYAAGAPLAQIHHTFTRSDWRTLLRAQPAPAAPTAAAAGLPVGLSRVWRLERTLHHLLPRTTLSGTDFDTLPRRLRVLVERDGRCELLSTGQLPRRLRSAIAGPGLPAPANADGSHDRRAGRQCQATAAQLDALAVDLWLRLQTPDAVSVLDAQTPQLLVPSVAATADDATLIAAGENAVLAAAAALRRFAVHPVARLAERDAAPPRLDDTASAQPARTPVAFGPGSVHAASNYPPGVRLHTYDGGSDAVLETLGDYRDGSALWLRLGLSRSGDAADLGWRSGVHLGRTTGRTQARLDLGGDTRRGSAARLRIEQQTHHHGSRTIIELGHDADAAWRASARWSTAFKLGEGDFGALALLGDTGRTALPLEAARDDSPLLLGLPGRAALAHIDYSQPLLAFELPVQAGGSLEIGQSSETEVVHSAASLFLGLRTLFGPTRLSFDFGDSGRQALQLFFATPW